jgi:hypothetical protein
VRNNDLISLGTAAELARVSVEQIRKASAAGKIYRDGDRVSRQSVEEWIPTIEINMGAAAALARVSYDTIRRAYETGQIQGRRTSPARPGKWGRRGGSRRLLRSSVEEWIEASKQPEPRDAT